MQTILVNKENKYPLYTAELAGQSWDKDTRYEMVIVTKWSDRTEKSKEVSHKAYYFTPDFAYLKDNIRKEEWCKDLYENHKEYEKFKIERKVDCYAENRN